MNRAVLILVALNLFIVAFAISNFLRSRIAGNQAAAVGSLRRLNTWCLSYC